MQNFAPNVKFKLYHQVQSTLKNAMLKIRRKKISTRIDLHSKLNQKREENLLSQFTNNIFYFLFFHVCFSSLSYSIFRTFLLLYNRLLFQQNFIIPLSFEYKFPRWKIYLKKKQKKKIKKNFPQFHIAISFTQVFVVRKRIFPSTLSHEQERDNSTCCFTFTTDIEYVVIPFYLI